MSETIFERGWQTCAAVADVSSHVRIHDDAIKTLADRLDLDRSPNDPARSDRRCSSRPQHLFRRSMRSTSAPATFPTSANGRARAATTPWRRVSATINHNGTITTTSLRRDVGDWAEVFGQELDGSPAHELMELTIALHDLADFVDATADARFVGVVEAAQGSAAAWPSRSRRCPSP